MISLQNQSKTEMNDKIITVKLSVYSLETSQNFSFSFDSKKKNVLKL